MEDNAIRGSTLADTPTQLGKSVVHQTTASVVQPSEVSAESSYDSPNQNLLEVVPHPDESLGFAPGNDSELNHDDTYFDSTYPSKPKLGFVNYFRYKFRYRKNWSLLTTGMVIFLIISSLLMGGFVLMYERSTSKKEVKNNATNALIASDNEPDIGNLSTKDILSVNAKLNVQNSLVVVPTPRPSELSVGQIYFDQNDSSLYFHNGIGLRKFAFIDDIESAIKKNKAEKGKKGDTGSTGKEGKKGETGARGPSGVASCPYGNCLSLQTTSPGAQESGSINISGNGIFAGGISAANFSGDGSSLTSVDAGLLQGQIGSYYLDLSNSTGVLSDTMLSSNVALININNNFSTSQSIDFAGGKSTLQLTSTGADTGITFGGDTNIYRSAPDTLKTDDGLVIGGISGGNSTTKLDVQNASGSSVLSVDTNNSRLEVVGDIYSKGTFWTSQASAADYSWNSVTYGNGIFVAVAYDGGDGTDRVMTSSDGINWKLRTTPGDSNSDWLSVTYGNGLFVAVKDLGTNDNVMTSPDGVNWTSRVTPNGGQWKSVTYGNGQFVAVGQVANPGLSRVMTSPDGINWTFRNSVNRNSWTSVAFGNGQYVAIADFNNYGDQVMTSPDGINWTSRTAASSNRWRSITYGNGLFVALADGGGNGTNVMTSPDGINWTSRVSAAEGNLWSSIAYGNGLFVAVSKTGYDKHVMTSPDGINWTSRVSAANNFWSGITYGNGLFVSVAPSGVGNRVMTSGKPDLSVVPNNNVYQGGMRVNGSSVFASGMNSSTTFQIQDAGGSAALTISTNNVTGGANGANAVLTVAKDSGTNRSINAAGSINASGADYAEWITWEGAKPSPGSVVSYKGSDYVVSSPLTAAFIGNDNYFYGNGLLVTFAGQVPVKVSGKVRAGDILVSNFDGTARAINPQSASFRDFMNKIAISQETSNDSRVKLINSAVGTNVSATRP